ncbi:DUF3396 domain-containing protein [Cronobacter sakazakii]|uniref:DUF3396 domain-containing protein n=1 Tax=Cronobacter sakazakii TaxID=28141 RepID=UPI00215819B5|nr:DUF3396 domain-containing protein [Cronobacter sakazakii]MDK1181455.1 DUF3396 domain-containing protein [Cronobacter sakazakii]MEB8578514.1 DUF3396 domain-containing protein [Cronobacter sakazakii]MEB8610369.1 DUF3396 domain-containing protein [Cronobacter sakazakii]
MDFFEKFKQAECDFTYGAEDDPEHHNALQVGLVAWFYLDKGYTKENRARIAEAWQLYHNEFGAKLKWGYIDDPNAEIDYRAISLKKFKEIIIGSFGNDLDFQWYSEKGFRYASNYAVSVSSTAGWYESIHKRVSCFGFYLPVLLLNNKKHLEDFLFQICIVLKPMHGLMGLGIQQCYEKERYQHLEYEICNEFNGVDVINSNTDKK